MRWKALAPVAVIALAATSGSAAQVSTGLRGVVTRGPITPVCRVGDACDERAAGVTLTFSRGARVVARVRTSDAGRYRVLLASGSYTVSVRPLSKLGRIDPNRVRVVEGRNRRVDFAIDTGIR